LASIKIGKYVIPVWLIAVLLISGIGGVLGYYVWYTLTIQFEVKEALKLLEYPTELSLYPGETEEFNVTIENQASTNYSVILDFQLSNTTYQDNYTTFSSEIYKVIPGQQNLSAWVLIESYAPPVNASLTINFHRTEVEGEVLFFDDFGDGVADGWAKHSGTWSVVDGEYSVGDGFSTVDSLNLTDCLIEVKLRFGDDSVGFRAGIVFRYADNTHCYSFEVSNEYDVAWMVIYTPDNPVYGFKDESMSVHVPISADIDYTLKVEVRGDTFTGFLDDQRLFAGVDEDYTLGRVGLHAKTANVFFDNFTVTDIPW